MCAERLHFRSRDDFVIAAPARTHPPGTMARRVQFLAASCALLVVTVASCGGTVTDVGSVSRNDAGGLPTDDAAFPGDGPSPGDARGDADATHDGGACPPPTCGTKVCGRSDCGRVCGVCALPGGCLIGHCAAACPSTPCVDVDGHNICEGERGARSCAGGKEHIEICTCSGGGGNAWIACGACL